MEIQFFSNSRLTLHLLWSILIVYETAQIPTPVRITTFNNFYDRLQAVHSLMLWQACKY